MIPLSWLADDRQNQDADHLKGNLEQKTTPTSGYAGGAYIKKKELVIYEFLHKFIGSASMRQAL